MTTTLIPKGFFAHAVDKNFGSSRIILKMNNQARVGEIYTTAGNAFKLLGELTSQMASAEESTHAPSAISAKWTNREIEMLQKAVGNFAAQLNQISEEIKTRAVDQIQLALQRQAVAAAGLPQPGSHQHQSQTPRHNGQVPIQ